MTAHLFPFSLTVRRDKLAMPTISRYTQETQEKTATDNDNRYWVSLDFHSLALASRDVE
jgi:hypothetical protein